jgi:peptidase A4-like protein
MRYIRLGLLGALALLPAFAQESLAPVAQDTTERLAPRQFGPIRDLTDHGNGTSTSSNWSGYAVLGSSFTWATGSWVVPVADCSGVKGDQYAAFWVGLDGYSSQTVEQTGTDSDCVGKTPNYYVWYEFYPRASYTVTSVPIQPGDVIYAFVYYDAAVNEFIVGVTDETTGKSFTKAGAVSGALRSSAEWITEAPCCTILDGILPLSDFGTVNFGTDSTGVAYTNWAKDSSTTGAIGSFPPVNTIVIDKTGTSSSPQTSTCSALSSDGTSFSCTWAP